MKIDVIILLTRFDVNARTYLHCRITTNRKRIERERYTKLKSNRPVIALVPITTVLKVHVNCHCSKLVSGEMLKFESDESDESFSVELRLRAQISRIYHIVLLRSSDLTPRRKI